ncbi:16155_t:CDS:2, partial [Acaulospora morrowiae]
FTPYNITNTCSATISSLLNDSTLTQCLPVSTIFISLPVILNFTDNSNPLNKIDLLAQIVKMTCALPKCSSATIQPVVDSIKTQCEQDLFARNQVAVPTFDLFNYYSVIRDIICLRNGKSEYNSFCVLETLINIGTASNATTGNATSSQSHIDKRRIFDVGMDNSEDLPNNFSSPFPTATVSTASTIISPNITTPVSSTSSKMTSSIQSTPSLTKTSEPSPTNTGSTCPLGSNDGSIISMLLPLSELPTGVICTDCNKAMTSVFIKYLAYNPNAFACTPLEPAIPIIHGFLSSKCNDTFLDMNTPDSVTSSGSAFRYQKFFKDFVNIWLICFGTWVFGLGFM